MKQLVALSLKNPVRLAADVVGLAPKALTQEIVRLKVRLSSAACVRQITEFSMAMFGMAKLPRSTLQLDASWVHGGHPSPPTSPSASVVD